MGVPPEKVADVMALMGDSIDNIPGAKGIGEKGAKELIRRFGSAEAALDRAKEVEGKRYREALENSREAVVMSKQLAMIDTDAPVKLVLDDLQASATRMWRPCARSTPSWDSPRCCAICPRRRRRRAATIDCAALDSPAALRKFLSAIPRGAETAVWLTLAEGEREDGRLRLAGRGGGDFAASPALRARRGATPRARCAPRSRNFCSDPARPKIVHDPKLVELLAGPVAGIRHATMLYSYLLRPTTAKHDLADAVLRQENVTLSGAPGEHADHLQRLAPPLRQEVEAQELARTSTRRLTCRSRRCWPRWSATACASIRKALAAMSETMEREIRALENAIWELAGTEFNVNSPPQLAEILFDKMNLDARRAAAAESRAPPPRTCSTSWRCCTNCRAKCSNTANSPSSSPPTSTRCRN